MRLLTQLAQSFHEFPKFLTLMPGESFLTPYQLLTELKSISGPPISLKLLPVPSH